MSIKNINSPKYDIIKDSNKIGGGLTKAQMAKVPEEVGTLQEQFEAWLAEPFNPPKNKTKDGLTALQPFVFKKAFSGLITDSQGSTVRNIPVNVWKKKGSKHQELYYLSDAWFKLVDNPMYEQYLEAKNNSSFVEPPVSPPKQIFNFWNLLDKWGFVENKFSVLSNDSAKINPKYIINAPTRFIENSDAIGVVRSKILEHEGIDEETQEDGV